MKMISMCMPEDLLAKAKEKAEANGLNLSAYIRQLIAKDLREEK